MAWLWDSGKRKVNFEDAISPYLTQLQTNFQTNINALYDKLVSLGSTPASKTPSAVSNAIQAINDSIYNKLVSLGQTPASKTVANLNAKIQALTEIQWQQSLSIPKITYTESGETKTLSTREVPFNCRDLVNIVIAFAYYGSSPLGSKTCVMGTITWYNASGTQVGSPSSFNVTVSTSTTGNFSQTFTPPSGAVRATLLFNYSVVSLAMANISNTPTATFKYQTKVLR